MKITAVAACAALTLVSSTIALMPSASATPTSTTSTSVSASAQGSPGCVTKKEYKKAKKGMTTKKVKAIFGTNGKREARASSGGYVSEIRSYKTCSKYSAVVIAFDKEPGGTLRLSDKTAVWVD